MTAHVGGSLGSPHSNIVGSSFFQMLWGFAVAAVLPLAAVGFAKLTLRIKDSGCGVLAGYVGLAAGGAAGVAHIRFLSPLVHGLLSFATALVAGGIAALLALGFRFGAAIRSGDSCFIDDWFPASINLDDDAG
jgi:hypothetical protein